jgi:hypothetical protein
MFMTDKGKIREKDAPWIAQKREPTDQPLDGVIILIISPPKPHGVKPPNLTASR